MAPNGLEIVRTTWNQFEIVLAEQNESYKQTAPYPRKLDSDPKQGFEPSILQTIKLLDCCRSRSTPGCPNLTSGIRESGRLNSHENGNGEFHPMCHCLACLPRWQPFVRQ